MADDKPEDAGLAPESGRAKRTPPTIDLEATEVSTQPQPTAAAEPEVQPTPEQATPEQATVEESKSEEARPDPEPAHAEAAVASAPASAPVSPWVIAPFSGAVAAAIVIAVGWMLGWPAVEAPPAAPQVTSATVDALERTCRRGRSQGGQARRRSGHGGADRCTGEIRKCLAQ